MPKTCRSLRCSTTDKSDAFHLSDEKEAHMNTSSSSSSIVSGVSQSRKVVAAEIDDHEDQEVLEDLFRISMKGYEMAEADSGKQTRHFDNREDLILLDGVDVDKHSRRKRNKEAPSQRDQREQSASASSAFVLDEGKNKATFPDLDRLDSTAALADWSGVERRVASKRAREARNGTAGSQWFGMPAFPTSNSGRIIGQSSASSRYSGLPRGPTAEDMRREVQAIRLRNALNPKRFYKGGIKDRGMPQYAELGRIISSPLEPIQTLTRRERGRTAVEELIRDAEASGYAKRKFSEHQVKASNGGRGHTKAKTRKPSDRKRRRR